MIDDTLLKTLKSTLINNESSLRNCKEWMGINKKNGLWDYIIRIDNVFKRVSSIILNGAGYLECSLKI